MKIRCGVDLVDVKRIGRIKNKQRFLERVFSADEISHIREKSFKDETIAGMYAAKEAVAKALKTGIGEISFKDIEISREAGISVKINSGKVKNILSVDISISHDAGMSVAFCTMIIGDEDGD
ncbi:MAG: holo-ACP synthase [Finegoldia sp.]|nr:holo-ACP synthase [Finegoldia sp.]